MKCARLIVAIAAALSLIMALYGLITEGQGLIESKYFQTALLFVIISLQLDARSKS